MVKNKWHLNPSDVTWQARSSGSSWATKNPRRHARSMGEREFEMHLTHIPTGIEVSGGIVGNYDRKEWTEQRNALYGKLFQELDGKVAKALRIPGR